MSEGTISAIPKIAPARQKISAGATTWSRTRAAKQPATCDRAVAPDNKIATSQTARHLLLRPRMRKLSPTLTALFCALAFAACGGPDDSADLGSDNAVESTTAEVRTNRPSSERTEERSTEERDTEDREENLCRSRIECRTDDVCPRGSYCESALNYCFTGSRCIVNGRPSNRFCAATYGRNFVCAEYAPDSHHCVPLELDTCGQ